MVSITAKSTYFKELLFPLFKIFYTLIMHDVINFMSSIGKQPYREAINYPHLDWLTCCKRQKSVVTLRLQTNMMQYSR